jgi:pyruvate/2-oxoglutarate dehydrogenase complex dihydrolipoamide acyltransferase (E2) component
MPADPLELRLPDFDLGDVPLTTSSWYAAEGQHVVEGDRLMEILAGDVTIDLPAPASGILIRQCVGIDEPLHTGQVLCVIYPA